MFNQTLVLVMPSAPLSFLLCTGSYQNGYFQICFPDFSNIWIDLSGLPFALVPKIYSSCFFCLEPISAEILTTRCVSCGALVHESCHKLGAVRCGLCEYCSCCHTNKPDQKFKV